MTVAVTGVRVTWAVQTAVRVHQITGSRFRSREVPLGLNFVFRLT